MADIDQVPDNLSDAGRIGSNQTPKSRTKALRPRQHFLKKEQGRANFPINNCWKMTVSLFHL